MPWTWSVAKNRDNKRKHGLSFETAQLVFDDPHALSRPDPFSHEERWQTLGVIGQITVIVIHTWPNSTDKSGIISARKATAHERRSYEEG